LGSADGDSNAVFNITNTSPNHSAVAAHGGQALSGINNTGGDGVGTYGGPSNGNGTPEGASNGGSGINATGGQGTTEFDTGGSGITANGGENSNSGSSSGGPGVGVLATGGTSTAGRYGGDAIDAYGGTGTEAMNGNAIYAQGGDGNYTFAGNFEGAVSVAGNLEKSGGSFKIDHPLDPANKYLYHSFVESPDMMNIYNGNAITDGSGTAIITMPAWFEALNTDFRYQLTVIGQFAQAIVAQKMTNGSFTIKTNKPGVEVSWQVTGIRQDAWASAHRIQVKVDKAPGDQGHYLHPELFGHEWEPNIAEIHHPRPPAPAK
jgi:trimeric autotransporter adhesin